MITLAKTAAIAGSLASATAVAVAVILPAHNTPTARGTGMRVTAGTAAVTRGSSGSGAGQSSAGAGSTGAAGAGGAAGTNAKRGAGSGSTGGGSTGGGSSGSGGTGSAGGGSTGGGSGGSGSAGTGTWHGGAHLRPWSQHPASSVRVHRAAAEHVRAAAVFVGQPIAYSIAGHPECVADRA
jgi:hypothetical protein